MTNKQNKIEEINAFAPEDRGHCETYLDHDPYWCGDCFACSKCGLIFISKQALKEREEEIRREEREIIANKLNIITDLIKDFTNPQ